MSIHDALSRQPTTALLRLSGLVMVALVIRLVALPVVVAAILADRLVTAVDTALTPRPTPPSPPRWAAANTRTRTYATV